MQVQISKVVDKRVKEASKILGLREKEIIDRAVLVYLDSMQKYLNLKRELDVWDKLSDEALKNFERDL